MEGNNATHPNVYAMLFSFYHFSCSMVLNNFHSHGNLHSMLNNFHKCLLLFWNHFKLEMCLSWV